MIFVPKNPQPSALQAALDKDQKTGPKAPASEGQPSCGCHDSKKTDGKFFGKAAGNKPFKT